MVDDICTITKCGIESVKWNAYINTQIELKKLRFHTPDVNGHSKCHKLHVGRKENCCPELKVHGTIMEEVTDDDYLGDIISNNGKNKMNLQKRISRGQGLISQILNVLNLVCFGQHYIEIALLLRNTIFLSSILNNVEIWYGLTSKEVEALEALDRLLLRKILKVSISTPKEALYLELGLVPIGILLKMMRVKYLYYLMKRSKEEMLSQFFWVQWNSPVRNDWTVTVRQDLADLGMSANPEELLKYSKYSLNKIVKDKARDYAFRILNQLKASHSKLKLVQYSEFKLQSYFTLPGVDISDLRNIFSFRVHMQNFAENFRSTASSRLCPLCEKHLDSQDMLATCNLITTVFKGSIEQEVQNVYSDNVEINSMKKVVEAIYLRDKHIKDK